MKEILKVRKVGTTVILYKENPFYSEIVIRCNDSILVDKVAIRLLYAVNDVNQYIQEIER